MAAKNNRTITLSEAEKKRYQKEFFTLDKKVNSKKIINKIINADLFSIFNYLPENFVDLLFIDPPYNLSKNYNGNKFHKKSHDGYKKWVESWLKPLIKILKPNASIYICGDWETSSTLHKVCDNNFKLLNRITIAREKGRGSTKSWKNNSEDIWFCAVDKKNYFFNAEAVKIRKKVIAPYKENGKPKDWFKFENGNFRHTYASNIWVDEYQANLWKDITIPFWSMPENTPHPTQKPEKLLAKIILASSKEGDVVFDPFAGVGTTGVVAKKLNRKFVIVEKDLEYCLFGAKRLHLAEHNKTIQGYSEGVFWERNTTK